MHIYRLILINLLLSNLAIWHTVINNKLADRYFRVGYLLWVIYLCSALCTLKPKKPLKNLKNLKKPKNLFKNSKNPRVFFQPCKQLTDSQISLPRDQKLKATRMSHCEKKLVRFMFDFNWRCQHNGRRLKTTAFKRRTVFLRLLSFLFH